MAYGQALKAATGWSRLGLPVLGVIALAFGLYLVNPPQRQSIATDQAANALPVSTNSLGVTFVQIPAGSFQMGGGGELASVVQAQTEPVRTVAVGSFWLAITEITQAQWQAVMGYNNSQFKDPRRPVDQVTFLEVQDFIRRLNRAEQTMAYRLPSEAEWEYAARSGSAGTLPATLSDYAWYGHHGNVGSRPVAGRRPNNWGLYDMLGNVWEWTEDCWHDNYQNAPADGRPWQMGGDCRRRVLRGGGWNTEAGFLGLAARGSYAVDLDDVTNGFRLAKTVADAARE